MPINSVNNLSSLQGASRDFLKVYSPLTLKELKEAVDKIYRDPKLRNSRLLFYGKELKTYEIKIPELQSLPLGVKALKTALDQLVKDWPERTYQKPSFEEYTPLNNPPAVRINLPAIMCDPPINYAVWQDTGKPLGIHAH
ncbi:MAG: hypothetical protein HYU63_08940 [Armatimonadetes bacterium]|nr:hypothetical protein [Armatimonadota bacterium]